MTAAAAAIKPLAVIPMGNPWGGPLTAEDYRALSARWIDRAHADAAMLSRVADYEGRQLVGQPRRNCAGILIPYIWPGETNTRGLRIRRDHPEIEGGKPKQKYTVAPGEPNKLYVPPTTKAALADTELPIIITEGEFKAIALSRLATHEADKPRFLPMAFAGVWNWKGTIGKTTDAKGARVDEKGPIPDLNRLEWKDRRVIVAFDTDAETNPSVSAAFYGLSRELRSRGAVVGNLEWEASKGKGVDDWLATVGPDEVLRAIEAVDFNRVTGWKALLARSDRGKALADLANVDVALRHSPDWDGVLGFDELRQRVRIIAPAPVEAGPIPRDWTSTNDTQSAIWMHKQGIRVGVETVGKAVQAIATERTFNPLKEWLETLQWDGDKRLDTWLSDYMSAAPSEYVSAVGRCWLVSAVARVYQPGCQVDSMPVFEGPQGCGKSSALRILAGDYFRDSIPDIHTKDASLQLFGAWILEWSELAGMGRSERELVKHFVSRQVESLRRPYGQHTEDVPRSCVFAGTTNNGEYLNDETGNRRFWPVKVGRVDLERLKADRDQLWAEAVALFKGGTRWYLDRPELVKAAAAEAEQRLITDPWLERIEEYTKSADKVKADAILDHLKIETGRQGQAEKNRVGRCLRALGFEPKFCRDMGRCYQRVTQ